MTDKEPDCQKRECFDPVTFIIDGASTPLSESPQFLCNQNGRAVYSPTPIGKQIAVTPEDPSLSLGQPYRGIGFTEKRMYWGTPDAYLLTVFDFRTNGKPVVYKPLWADADRRYTQGFGMTLVRNGECLPFHYPGMIDAAYTYGVMAGYESPYIDRTRQMLSVNATDLEYHAFPHAFCSIDVTPLVISVARWRQSQNEIYLADLWVRPGDLLFVPPKFYSEQYIDMHGNRNSAFACWGMEGKSVLYTRTTLGDSAVFAAEETKPHYHMEKTHTIHSQPD